MFTLLFHVTVYSLAAIGRESKVSRHAVGARLTRDCSFTLAKPSVIALQRHRPNRIASASRASLTAVQSVKALEAHVTLKSTQLTILVGLTVLGNTFFARALTGDIVAD